MHRSGRAVLPRGQGSGRLVARRALDGSGPGTADEQAAAVPNPLPTLVPRQTRAGRTNQTGLGASGALAWLQRSLATSASVLLPSFHSSPPFDCASIPIISHIYCGTCATTSPGIPPTASLPPSLAPSPPSLRLLSSATLPSHASTAIYFIRRMVDTLWPFVNHPTALSLPSPHCCLCDSRNRATNFKLPPSISITSRYSLGPQASRSSPLTTSPILRLLFLIS